MSSPSTGTSEDLWTRALQKLPDKDKTTIDFNDADKLQALVELRALTERAREECTKKRWKYVRGGKTVILRDLFGKIIHWVDLFKRIGDVTTRAGGDMKTGLAWLAVRFLLQIAVNDIHKYAFVVEGAELVSRLIDRYTVFETLYLLDPGSSAEHQLREALIRFYACILRYLVKAKAYYEQNTLKRIVVGAIVLYDDFKTLLDDVEQEQKHVDRCVMIVDAERRNVQTSKISDLLLEQEAVRESLTELVDIIDGPISRMTTQVSDIQDHLEHSKRLDILRWISPLPYQEYHDQHRRSVLDGTGKWLLTDPMYTNWKNDSTSSLLWLHGTPGCGKSKLVAIVVEELLQGFNKGDNPFPAFFYCSRNTAEPERARPDDVLASIARQLSSQGSPGSPLCQSAIDCYSDNSALHSTKITSSRVLPLIQKLVGLRLVTYIIIDALDECDPATRCDLLDILNELIQDPFNLVKVFVSSRDDQDISDTLRDVPSISVTSQKNQSDLSSFVTHETESLVSRRRLLRFSEDKEVLKVLIIRKLTEGADGMFLWVTLQLEVLCRLKLDDDIRDRLGRLPSKLAQLYSEIYEQLVLTEETRLTIGTILKWLLCARETLRTPEFLAAISLNPMRWRGGRQPQRLFTKEQVLDLCCNLVVYDDELDTFRFAHLSVREFLEQRPEYSISLSNALAAETCLVEIIHSAGIPSTKHFLNRTYGIDVSRTSLPSVYALHQYAIYYWPGHCADAGAERSESSNLLQKTFRFFLSDNSADGCPMNIWVQSRRRRRFETSGGHRLVRLLGDYVDSMTRSFFVACTYGFCDIIHIRLAELSKTLKQSGLMLATEFEQLEVLQLLQNDPEIEITEDMVVQIAKFWDNAADILPTILTRESHLRVTEFILHQATNASDVEVMRLLLNYAGNTNEVTDDVLRMAAFWGTSEMMEFLLDRLGSDERISEGMMGTAAEHNLPVLRVLLRRGGRITGHVIKRAAQHYRHGKEVLDILESHGAKIIPTEDIMNAAALRGNVETMLFLLSKGGCITEDVMKSAARNYYSGANVLEMLFDRWDGKFTDEQEILEIAAGNVSKGGDLLRLLFEKLDSPQVTPSIMKAGAANPWVAEEVLGVLLERGGKSQVTPEVIIAAAYKPSQRQTEVVSLLLTAGEKNEITEQVLVAVIASVDHNKVIEAMFESTPSTLITDAVLRAGFQNSSAVTMTKMLFDRVGKERITPEIIAACVGNSKSGVDVLAALEKLSGPIEVTDELLRAAARTGSRRMLQTLLKRLPTSSAKVSEDLMIAAASNVDTEIIAFLLDEGGYEFVTDEVLKVVVTERHDVHDLLPILVRRGGIQSISEAVAKAAVESGRGFALDQRRVIKSLLNQSQVSVRITDDVVAAALANRDCLGDDLIQFLLQYCADRNIPISVDHSVNN